MTTCIAATLNLIIGMLTKSIMAGILVATILMIHLILLTTIFVNFDTMKIAFFRGLRYLSFFNYGYEALVVNELAGRTIKDFQVRSPLLLLSLLCMCVCNV
jgi:ABC-type multidrug transport system permease subunit